MKTSSTLLFLGVCLLFINVVVGLDCDATQGFIEDSGSCVCDGSKGLILDSGACICNIVGNTDLEGSSIDTCKCKDAGKVPNAANNACECDATQGLTADSGAGCECNTAITGLTGTGIDCKCDVGKVLKDDGSACECDTKSGWVDNKDGSACECEEGKVQTGSGTCEAKGGASSIASSTIMSILYPLVVAWSLKMISM